jgi:hypothetical protein
MFVKFVLATACVFASTAMLASSAHADTLATPAKKHYQHRRYATESRNAPGRGMSMAQVEKRYGAPLDKLPPAGGDAPRHPTINRWRYNGYTVYFERSRVIHSVFDSDAAAPKS